MGGIRIVGPGKTRGYPYPVCKKRIVGPGETRDYPYPVCKKRMSSLTRLFQHFSQTDYKCLMLRINMPERLAKAA